MLATIQWPMRALLLLAALLLAGCSAPGDSPISDRHGVNQPLQPVQDPYYDVVPKDEMILAHNIEYFVAGAVGDSEFGFHSFEEVEAKMMNWNATYPDLVELRVAGKSHLGNPIYHVIVTDESVPADGKVAAMFEGGIHGNEYGGSEILLYTVDLLLENHANNATVRAMLRHIDIHVIPVTNPDGYMAGKRANHMGVNLNRNWDVDWGNPAGASNPFMGLVANTTGQPFGGIIVVAENCGAEPFSEPETRAVRDVMLSLGDRAAFHLAGHAPAHSVLTVPAAADPPFEVPPEHVAVLDEELEWIRQNTEYEAGRAGWGDFSAGIPYAASGSSMDWWYAVLGKPSFTLETEYWPASATAEDYPHRLAQEYEGLRFWMDATLPLTMHLLSNARELANWESPTQDALLPEGWQSKPLPARPAPAAPYVH